MRPSSVSTQVARYEDHIFSAVRHGTRPNRTFNLTATGRSIDFVIPPEATIDRAAVIADWSHAPTHQAYLGQMPPGWVPHIVRDPYAPTQTSHTRAIVGPGERRALRSVRPRATRGLWMPS